MDSIIEIVSILFVLSLVCERVAEFVKCYLSEFKIFNFQITGNTVKKFPLDSTEEQLRGYRILKLNLWCGFFTAVACHASLFDILTYMVAKANELPLIFEWPDLTALEFDIAFLPSNIWFLLGCFLTGSFISLGSKFWHDLLDLLLVVKNARRPEAIRGATDFTKLSETEQQAVLRAAIQENRESWKTSFKNYRGVSIGKKIIGEGDSIQRTDHLALRFNVAQKQDLKTLDPNRIPDCIFYKGYKIPTDVIPVGEIRNASQISPDLVPRPLGCSIGRRNSGTSGTLGPLMSLQVDGKKKIYGISCYHVLFSAELRSSIREVKSPGDLVSSSSAAVFSPAQDDHSQQMTVGSVSNGLFNEYLDIGFFELADGTVTNNIFGLGKPAGVYHAELHDENRLEVKMYGKTSDRVQEGIVESVEAYPLISYFNGALTHELKGVLQIRMTALEGDSGAAIVDRNLNIVGILVAVDDTYAYALPARFVENNFPHTFETN